MPSVAVRPRGRWNEQFIGSPPVAVIHTGDFLGQSLRYIQALPSRAGAGLQETHFLCRVGQYLHTTGFKTVLVQRLPVKPAVTVVVDDSISHNLCAARDPRTDALHLYGGQTGYDLFTRARLDGIRHLQTNGIANLRSGGLIGRRGDVVLRGTQQGCVSRRHSNSCEYDGKLSAVIREDGETLLYMRQNRKSHGGRFVGVSRAPNPVGPFSRIEQLAIDGLSLIHI